MKFIKCGLSLALSFMLLVGCGVESLGYARSAPRVSTIEAQEAKEEKSKISSGDLAKIENSNYEFNPHIFSKKYELLCGEEMMQSFFSLCDALRAGEDTFSCKDSRTYEWCTNRLLSYFFPVARQSIYSGKPYYNGRSLCKNGVGTIIYTVPKEDFLQKEQEFEDQICQILNENIGTDYSDFEKALSLYCYISYHYSYDYKMSENNKELYSEQSPYRCLTEKQGICWEIGGLYNYLLLQCGVDSEEYEGWCKDDDIGLHSWVYVTIDGKGYHVDPTWAGVKEDNCILDFFMMTDDIRYTRDAIELDGFYLGQEYDCSRDELGFSAVDDSYSGLWNSYFIGFDSVKNVIYYRPDGQQKIKKFSYTN